MILTYSQPYFIPWPGFFYRAARADKFVLLDSVQFPRGFTWINRNRIKGKDGELWLTIPVHRKGRGLQQINQVEIYYGENWIRKHIFSFQHSYKNSPFFEEIFPELEKIYSRRERFLVDFLLPLLDLIRNLFQLRDNFVLQSSLGVKGRREKLIIALAENLGADTVLVPREAGSHMDFTKLKDAGIKIETVKYRCPVYPQLWGDFIKNLSSLDILFNIGPIAQRVALFTKNKKE